MNQVTVMFRKTSVRDAGGYIDWYCEEDYYLWLRMFLLNMRFANIQDVLVNVRVKDMYRRRGGIRYFNSEMKLQRFMLSNGIISFLLYCINVVKRFTVQVILPNKLCGFALQKLARKKPQ